MVFEWFGPYDFLVRREWSFDSAVAFVLANHLTFINDNLGKVPEDQMPKLEKLARLAGYRSCFARCHIRPKFRAAID